MRRVSAIAWAIAALVFLSNSTTGQQPSSDGFHAASAHHNPPDLNAVPEAQWQAIDESVERGLAYLKAMQNRDGSIPTRREGTPAVTALYAMAAISAGHQPGIGSYGDSINRAIDFILSVQCDDGLFSLEHVTMRAPNNSKVGQLALYNHGICGTLLGEVYGMTDGDRAERIKAALEKAIPYVRSLQQRSVPPIDQGGWRYVKNIPSGQPQSDLSVTSWQIMFMRSAHNAGFEVPKDYVEDALEYVKRCYVSHTGEFRYAAHTATQTTRGMTGAGVLCLFLTGNYDDEIERTSGAWIAQQSFTRFNTARRHDRYFYAAYYCSQAAYQLGGEYWPTTYVPLAQTLVAHQNRNGSWAEDHHNGEYGKTYSTAMAILALTPPYQLLPIYQR